MVYSDSQESEVIELLGDLRNEFEIEIFHFEPLETLRNLMNFENFIGTNSKISLWASVFRQAKIEDSKSALPKEICKQALEMNTGWALGSISNF